MKCEDARYLFDLAIDGTLDSGRANGLAKHLEDCERCTREYELLCRVDHALDSLRVERAPAWLTEAVMKSIARRRALERVTRITAPLIAAASIGFCVLRPMLDTAFQMVAGMFDSAVSGLSRSCRQMAHVLGGKEAAVLERAPDLSNESVAAVVAAGAVAAFLIVEAVRLWRQLALAWCRTRH